MRDHVRSDDIDNGIEMLLDSFLQSQKHSVARQLSKKFEQYKQKRTNANQLLNFTLSKMVSEQASYEKYRKGYEFDVEAEVTVKIALEQLEQKAREMNVHQMNEFLNSKLFTDKYALENKMITATLRV